MRADARDRTAPTNPPGAPDPPVPPGACVDVRRVGAGTDPAALWAVLDGLGGADGWYGADLVWRLRGALDRVLGGAARAPRRGTGPLRVGDPVDWWRVERHDPGRLLSLRSTMRLPGTARLDLAVGVGAGPPGPGAGVELVQRMVFAPSGPLGRLYWQASAAAHPLALGALATGIAAAARRRGAPSG